MSELTWAMVLSWADRPAELVPVLLAAPEPERLAFAPELTTRVKALRGDDWWATPRPGAVIALTAIACLPTAARAATVIGRQGVLEWSGLPIPEFLEIARARRLPWLGDLGLRLAARLRPSAPTASTAEEWRLVSALIREGGAEPPTTAGFVRGWLRELHGHDSTTPPALLERLRDDPWRDTLLPAVFELDGLGSELLWQWWDLPEQTPAEQSWEGAKWKQEPAIAPAVARLTEEGLLDRKTIYAATMDRLVRGDKAAYLRAFTLLHDELAPTVDEMAGCATDYALLLANAPSTVAALAQRALRELDAAGRLDLSVLLEASAGALVRKEKGLTRAQLTWLTRVARRDPTQAAEIHAAMAVALDHPSADIREQARNAIGPAPVPDLAPHLSRPATDLPLHLSESAISLAPDLSSSANSLAPDLSPPGAGLTPHPSAPVTAIASPAELAEQVGMLLDERPGVTWERVLAALVQPGMRDSLPDLLDRFDDWFPVNSWTRLGLFGAAIRSILADETRIRSSVGLSQLHTPEDLLRLRIAEVAERWPAEPITVLMATPTHVNGTLDATVLTERLEQAQAEGWEPWPLDYEQALLRVTIDPSALPRAERLTSARGRQFAEWLASGGLPEPISTRFTQKGLAVNRIVAALDPSRTDGPGLVLETPLTTLSPPPKPDWGVAVCETPDVLAMVLPHHREVTAAWAVPGLAALADQDERDASLLPMLAEANGPIGPAMALALIYGLAARHEPDRIAAVDALLILTARPEPFTTAAGAELGALGAMIKLSRVATALGDAHRAGASAAVWEVIATALPALLPASPRGLPDLLEVAAQAATAIGAHATIPELTTLATGNGSSRLLREARRLRDALNPPRSAPTATRRIPRPTVPGG